MRLRQKAFTLIELLVVIAIIGLLASVVLIALTTARRKANDTKRLADIRQLQTALDIYYDQNSSTYPNPDADVGGCGGWDTSSVDPFLTALVTSGVVTKTPVDPLNSGGCAGYTYRYYRYGAGTSGCDPNRGAFYLLEVSKFESTPPPITSPGFSCSGRDWGPDGQWVMGKFEK